MIPGDWNAIMNPCRSEICSISGILVFYPWHRTLEKSVVGILSQPIRKHETLSTLTSDQIFSFEIWNQENAFAQSKIVVYLRRVLPPPQIPGQSLFPDPRGPGMKAKPQAAL